MKLEILPRFKNKQIFYARLSVYGFLKCKIKFITHLFLKLFQECEICETCEACEECLIPTPVPTNSPIECPICEECPTTTTTEPCEICEPPIEINENSCSNFITAAEENCNFFIYI